MQGVSKKYTIWVMPQLVGLRKEGVSDWEVRKINQDGKTVERHTFDNDKEDDARKFYNKKINAGRAK